MTPSQFESHIRFLKDCNYRFCTLDGLLSEGDGAIGPCRTVAMTFDDGYLALRDFAFPILRQYSVPASVFIVTAFVGKKNLWDVNIGGRRFEHLAWSDIEAAASWGIKFYSHTATHRDLTRLDQRELQEELLGSRNTIELKLSQKVPYLSYPFGIYNASVARAARDCGYEAAFTLFKRRGENADPLYSVERTAVYRIDTIGSLRRKLERGSGARVERLKAHAINWCSRGTPVAKGLSQFLRGNSFSRLLEG